MESVPPQPAGVFVGEKLKTENTDMKTNLLLAGFLLAAVAAPVQLLSGQDPPAPGSVDTTFQPLFVCDEPLPIVVQPDGRLLVASEIYNLGIPGLPYSATLLRIGRDGAYDPTFTPFSTNYDTKWELSAMALQPDGKVVVGTVWSGTRRLNPDGSWDTNFLRLEVPADYCYRFFWATALMSQPDGKLLGTGRRYVRDECSGDDPYWDDPTLYRWLPNGALDNSFAANGWYEQTFLLLTNNQILVTEGGSLSRLHSDGTQDTNFVAGPFSDAIKCFAIQPDGRILVGGYFTSVQGQDRSHIARPLPDGRLDTSFNPPRIEGAWISPKVCAVAVQTDGRILVGGMFDTLDGLPYGALGRLNPDGTLDPTFNPVPGLRELGDDDGIVTTLVIQDETHAFVGGDFCDTFESDSELFRIHLGEPAPRLSIHQESGGLLQLNFPYSGSYDFAVAYATNLTQPASNWTVLGAATNAGAGQYRFHDPAAPAAGPRFYQLRRLATP